MSLKKILAVVMASAMAIGAFAASALTLDVAEAANETNDEVAVLAATTLPAAVDGVVTLTEDVVLAETLVINSNVTIDLAGHKITSADVTGEETRILKLIEVKNASLTIKDSVGGGKVVMGTCENLKSYNNDSVTIEAYDSVITVDGAAVEGQYGINTKFSGHAIRAYRCKINLINGAVVKGGDNDKKDIENENADVFYKYQGNSGKGIYAYGCDIVVTDSFVYGGNGTVSGTTKTTGYISGGANQASGGVAVEARSDHVTSKKESTLNATNSVFNGGTSATYEPEDALNIQSKTVAVLDNCRVIGGSVNPGMGNYGVGGNGVYLSGTPTVTIKNSTVVAGAGKSSTKNGALEVGSWNVAATVVVENSVLDGGKFYAIGGSGTDKLSSFTLKDTTVKGGEQLIEDNNLTSITIEGTLTVDENSANKTLAGDNTAIYTTTGATINGTDTVVEAKKVVAEINGTKYETVQAAIDAAANGDTVKVMPGTYSAINISNKNITLEGTVGANGELLTEIKGGNPAIAMHGFNGTIKNIKITNAWKVTYAEPAGNVTFDNIYVTGATYGLHLVAYSKDLTWNLVNSYLDLAWANSFGVAYDGNATINIINNKFASTNPYYPDYGALPVNTFLPEVNVEGNVFGEDTRILVDKSITDTSKINIGANYYADGVENVFANDVKVEFDTYYSALDENGEPTGLVDVTKKYAATVKSADGTIVNYETFEAAIAAAVDGDTVVIVADGEYGPLTTLPDVTIKAAEGVKAVINRHPSDNSLPVTDADADVVFENLTFNYYPNIVYEGYQYNTTTFNNCTINGQIFLYAKEDTFNNCTFNQTSSNDYNVWTYGSGVATFNKCTFNSAGKSVLIYNENGVETDAAFNNSIFYASEAVEGKAAIEIDSSTFSAGKDFDVVITDCSSAGFAKGSKSGDPLWNVKKGTAANASVVVNGFDMFEAEHIVNIDFVKADVDENGVDNYEESDIYNINIVGANDAVINRLNSGELTFAFTSDKPMAYEILDIAGDNITVTNVEGNDYEFHFETKTNVTNDTAKIITVAQVKFTGYGKYNFAVVDGAVHATTGADNIVDSYTPDGIVDNGEGKFDISEKLEGLVINVPTRELTVNVTFPNSVVDRDAKYQDMTVTISGGDLAEAIVTKLGDNSMNDAAYTVTANLTKNIAYNVTVSGAGYRTARYTVTMTDAKTLNFWNNVKDNKVEVEEGKASSATEKNFLAGDIVADNQINIYDLSAVVSYFATEITDEADYEKYVKYDLNRDGVINSKDVAYVLVSWQA